MYFDVGKLNKRIDFVHKVESTNELGQIVLQDEVYKTVWAKVSPMRGYETTIEDRLQPKTVYTIITRYHVGITQNMRIKYKGKMLDITQVCDIDEGHYALEITAVERGGAIGSDRA